MGVRAHVSIKASCGENHHHWPRLSPRAGAGVDWEAMEERIPWKQMSSEIEIDASPERVWQVLTDFPALPAWSPFIRSVEGKLEVDERLKVYIKGSKGMGMTFKPKVLKVEPNREFRWLGHFLIPGLFDGEHYFSIEPLEGDRVRLVQGEIFRVSWLDS